MPELDNDSLRALRDRQKNIERCPDCTAQIYRNYCRQCDEIFSDNHWPVCKRYNRHSTHRKY